MASTRSSYRRRSPLKLLSGAALARAPGAAPVHLSDAEREVWSELVSTPAIKRCASSEHRLALELLSTCVADRRALRKKVADEGGVWDYETTTETGAIMRRPVPERAMIDTLDRRIESLLGRFGLSPADSSRVASGDPAPAQDPDAEFYAAPKRR